MAKVEQGRGDYGREEEDKLEDVKDRVCNEVDDSPSGEQVVHCEIEVFMIASEGS